MQKSPGEVNSTPESWQGALVSSQILVAEEKEEKEEARTHGSKLFLLIGQLSYNFRESSILTTLTDGYQSLITITKSTLFSIIGKAEKTYVQVC